MRRTPLARVSARRTGERLAYEKAKLAAWNRDRGQCQAARTWPEIECGGRKDPHHVRPTGMWPELRCDPDNLITLCRAHHDAVHHFQPAKARTLGLLW